MIDGMSDVQKFAGVLIRDYTGDDSHNRVIDLGDDYDVVCIITGEGHSYNSTHPAVAFACRDYYYTFVSNNILAGVRHYANAPSNSNFQGKMSGADATKIKLGSTGTKQDGTNDGTKVYRIYAFKFAGVAS